MVMPNNVFTWYHIMTYIARRTHTQYGGNKMVTSRDNRDGSCNGRSASDWSDPHQAPPKILSGGKYKTRVGGGTKLALALIGRGGKAIVDWSRKEWVEGNGIQLRQ